MPRGNPTGECAGERAIPQTVFLPEYFNTSCKQKYRNRLRTKKSLKIFCADAEGSVRAIYVTDSSDSVCGTTLPNRYNPSLMTQQEEAGANSKNERKVRQKTPLAALDESIQSS